MAPQIDPQEKFDKSSTVPPRQIPGYAYGRHTHAALTFLAETGTEQAEAYMYSTRRLLTADIVGGIGLRLKVYGVGLCLKHPRFGFEILVLHPWCVLFAYCYPSHRLLSSV